MNLLVQVAKALLAGFLFVVGKFIWNYLTSPCKSFPGPFAAKFTHLWRFFDVWNGRCDITHNRLHRKYGPAVKMGPNIISLSDPNVIGKVFTARNPWTKSDMHKVNDVVINGVRLSNFFSTRDEHWHATAIKPIKSLYSMSRVTDVEYGVDKSIRAYTKKLQEKFIDGPKPEVCDMSDWMLYFAWDTMSEITFKRTLGLVEAGEDKTGLLKISSGSLDYFAPVCQIPELDLLMDKNPIKRFGPPTFAWANVFSVEALMKRKEDIKAGVSSEYDDYLDKFLQAKEKNPELVEDNMVITYLLSNVLAGSDTTAITLCAATYYVLKNPEVQRKLEKELDSANLEFPVSWKATQTLPYLDAVMLEAMRIHSGVGLMLERIVPKEGFTLPDGRYIPAGTIVGMNPWVIHRNEEVFGPDVETFRPERWLQQDGETEEEYEARKKKMKGANLAFGAGPRTCLGKFLSFLESYKLIGTMFGMFDISLADPNQEWHVQNSWFVRQSNIKVNLKRKGEHRS
ncbi:hypothetical protein FQN54_006279 [Arachnomyces sp. PD_36]|nr:hypothetical protein FQN54_006279 [Arachnomyces sp. PD_36]